MHVEFLVEERSAEVALETLLPRLIPNSTFDVHQYNGKKDLLRKLPERMRAYGKWIEDAGVKVVVVIDEDREDCEILKGLLEDAARDAGLGTKSMASENESFSVLNRIAIEELEAWFLGDPEAVRSAYPRVSQTFEKRARLRDPDSVPGGTWEALERLLQRGGYHKTGLRKVEAARAIAEHMDANSNRSRSFEHFRTGLAMLVSRPSGREASEG